MKQLILALILIFNMVQVFGSSLSSGQNPDPDPESDSDSSAVLSELQALKNKMTQVEEELKGVKGDLAAQQKVLSQWNHLFKQRSEDEEEIRRNAKGAPGEKGDKGDPGQDGKDGEKGEIGPGGPEGDSGEKGDKGDFGVRGEKGAEGPRGEKGNFGQNGLAGENGQKGDSGKDGTPGEKGIKGEKGQWGEIGMAGPVGPVGPKGERGQKGHPGPKGDEGISVLESITSCSDAMEILPSSRSKKQKIYPHGNRVSVEVLCDFESDGGGWTIIQKRTSGPKQDFNRTWNEYSKGFGSLDGNFWLGLENISALTKTGDQELRIELEDFEGEKKWAKYSSFSMSNASDFYRLSVGNYSGNARDSLHHSDSKFVHHGMRFSTKDKDNDQSSGNCAQKYGGGWWFNACFGANLNGPYFEEGENGTGIYWSSWNRESLSKVEMKIRKRK